MAVKWAIKGPSYRDARDRFCDLLGYQVTSHEMIRQEALKINPKEIAPDKSASKKGKDILFLEVDGLNVHKQNSTRKSREIKNGIVHEGWNGMIRQFGDTLIQALKMVSNAANPGPYKPKDYPSFAHLLTERARPSIGAIQGAYPCTNK